MNGKRLIAVPVLMLASGLVLAGCGDKDTPAATPAPTQSAMMDDGSMSPSPMTSSDAMEDDSMDADG